MYTCSYKIYTMQQTSIKYIFKKIEQSSGGVASDHDVTKAHMAIQVPEMIISKEEIINSHVSWWPMRRPEKWML